MSLAAAVLTALPAVIPDPNPTAPPGSDGITTLLNWVSWGCIIGAVFAFILCAGSLAFSHFTGRSEAPIKGLALAILAAMLVGGVGGIMRTFV